MRENTVRDRLRPTLEDADFELAKARRRARITGYALNACIGAQVVFGAITTGVAAASTSGHQTSIAVAVLGGMSTLAASYLARARGSGEPERSAIRVKELEHFKRECDAYILDNGHHIGPEYDSAVMRYRRRLEEILGDGPPAQAVQGYGLPGGMGMSVNGGMGAMGAGAGGGVGAVGVGPPMMQVQMPAPGQGALQGGGSIVVNMQEKVTGQMA
ncbi:hypothetical protein WOLCODRAFT_78520 [Wolfiporia cocos MD-104 SS10]|uniref:SMODS and SLOG-associating 2TM effector domain-containing protein n=1 Tax=Wolfiporia cocos (strain MD-104) TaxID=742152 RepID=A0A2H3JDA0_WOLCO|nr:hypothetical protein WOLCODRAFT_78520 [Wolfiporia cocos MD-104 SS10]